MATIPESHQNLLSGPYYAVFTTMAPDGVPENTIVWCSLDGDRVLVNTAAGRRKDTNVRENSKVALCVLDPEDAFRWIDVRGEVEDIVPDPDYENIDWHAKIYAGKEKYYGGVAPADMAGTEERIIFRIKPDRVVTSP
jgi:PPOX class probable F420-dependent enzyme